MLFMQHDKVKKVRDLSNPWPAGMILKDCMHCGGDVMSLINETDRLTKCLMCSRTRYVGTFEEPASKHEKDHTEMAPSVRAILNSTRGPDRTREWSGK